jgi:hypothetical protein
MNIVLTHIHAAASARFCGKNAFVSAMVLGCAMACASVPAFAGQDRDRDGARNPQQQQQPVQPSNRDQQQPPPRAERMPPQPQPQPQQRADPRQYDSHAYDEQHRQAQQQEQGARRGGRLTPDERRELRRQINDAGVEVYPNTPRR